MDTRPAKDSVAEAVRVSHCSHPYPDTHKCVGQCTITAKGVTLDCTICGEGQSLIADLPGYHRLSKILGFVGINIDLLDPYCVRSMLDELNRKPGT